MCWWVLDISKFPSTCCPYSIIIRFSLKASRFQTLFVVTMS
ncbi:hypothetical protein ES332_A11G231300v1 [Gossypium tomentosum]|uniref:Uncharacterized protein n=1 Tax=Gossypium tomentosum TaxID=34277 RepID=A0A5D2NI29_GOSTO|nr:hypothetical protein ES332_A11G231300v1 [Gossypium tomentosum]